MYMDYVTYHITYSPIKKYEKCMLKLCLGYLKST